MGNSQLRPTTEEAHPDTYAPRNGDAYLIIYNAVKEQRGLIHGQLHNAKGEHCAIGSYFKLHPSYALSWKLIDEVAAVNDSCPSATPRQRRLTVMRWLRWKLGGLGMPGFVHYAKKAADKQPGGVTT